MFSWGNDNSGQLGLGPRNASGNQRHTIPRYCSFNVAIVSMACGLDHTIFLTSKYIFNVEFNSILYKSLALNLVYSMGSNAHGQLGIGDVNAAYKYSPILLEELVDKDPV